MLYSVYDTNPAMVRFGEEYVKVYSDVEANCAAMAAGIVIGKFGVSPHYLSVMPSIDTDYLQREARLGDMIQNTVNECREKYESARRKSDYVECERLKIIHDLLQEVKIMVYANVSTQAARIQVQRQEKLLRKMRMTS